MIEQFGPRVANAWNHLRAPTRQLVERALGAPARPTPPRTAQGATYDHRADEEPRQLLAALDEHISQAQAPPDRQAARRVADVCATLLSEQTQSAEIFGQLIERAHRRQDYAQVDKLAELLPKRLAPSEICELARAGNVIVRALAQEALTQVPTSVLAMLLRDPVDALVARQALERQAFEFSSPEAQHVLQNFDESRLEEY